VQPRVQIVITVSADGGVQLAAPLHDKILCYGLLELAKDMVRAHNAASEAGPRIQLPTPRQTHDLLGAPVGD
jgi:hypothetical protein